MMTLIFFTVGGAAGAAIGYAWHHAGLILAKDTAKKEQGELQAEIDRLRAQVALHINK